MRRQDRRPLKAADDPTARTPSERTGQGRSARAEGGNPSRVASPATGRSTADSPQAPAPPARRLTRKRRETIAAWLFIAPDALGLFLFVGLPMLLALGLGFFHVTGFGEFRFIGLQNYETMLSDPIFGRTIRVTVTYVVTFVVGLFFASLGLALLVREQLPTIGLVRSLIFLPNVVSLVVIGLVWRFLLVDPVGAVNQFLRSIGMGSHSWLGHPSTALGTLVAVSIWFFMGYYMIIFLAALQDIPREYYEAARIDGASGWALFRNITWPLIRPTSLFVLLLATITGVAGLQAFDLIYVMTGGGPANSTSLAIFYVYQQAFQFGNFGYAAAMASVLVLFLLVWSMVLFIVTKGGRFDLG